MYPCPPFRASRPEFIKTAGWWVLVQTSVLEIRSLGHSTKLKGRGHSRPAGSADLSMEITNSISNQVFLIYFGVIIDWNTLPNDFNIKSHHFDNNSIRYLWVSSMIFIAIHKKMLIWAHVLNFRELTRAEMSTKYLQKHAESRVLDV